MLYLDDARPRRGKLLLHPRRDLRGGHDDDRLRRPCRLQRKDHHLSGGEQSESAIRGAITCVSERRKKKWEC